MFSNLKILLENKINSFYFVLILNVISLIFEFLCIVSIPLFVSSIFNPDLILAKYDYYNLKNIININLNDNNVINFSIFFLVSSFLLKNFFLIYIYIYQGKLLKQAKINLEKRIFDYYIKTPFINHTRNNPASILRTINDEVMGFYNYTYHLLVFIREVFTLLLIFSIFAFTNFQASLIASIFLLFLTILYVKYVKPIIKTRSINNQIFRKNMSQSIMEAFKAIQDIKIYNKELYVKKNFLENVNKFEQNHFLFGLLAKLPRVVLEIISIFVGLIFIFFILKSNASLNYELLSVLALFAIGIIRFIPAFNAVAVSLNYLKIFKASIKLLVRELKNFEKVDLENNVINKDYKPNSINRSYLYLENISFNYDEFSSFKIKPFSFQIKKGKKIAIMGKTGSGKSTFNYIFTSLIKPKSGNIFYCGNNIQKINVKWKRKIGYVSQNIFLFNSSIKDNITMFSNDRSVDQKKLDIALKISNLNEKISSIKHGIDSLVGVDGLSLSGGERQRVAIARAIYKDPEILFLDEFTSAIDNKTRANILQKLFKFFEKKTIVLITHDLNIAKKCDEIYFINNGSIKKK